MLEKILGGGKLEKKALENIKNYLQIFISAQECLKNLFLTENLEKSYCIENLEREADSVRREIISTIYEGAFLPYIRPNLCTFIEITEKAFDFLKTCAFEFRYFDKEFYQTIKEEVLRIANINIEMAEILYRAFQSLMEKNNLREKNLAIRIYEKKVDEIKLDLIEKVRQKEITNFWEGKNIDEFLNALVKISDIIEDASDYLYILDISLK
ncbi:MAG: Phosphate transport regulator YkaA [Thermodesulfobacterium sp.]|uniref:Phosphate transport regulator YkaA n=1 Tax=Candidatus Thermodesulfobacterium syntrophicum TaxID=3060442 RepID=A0AAE3P5C0_9BACT|nr:TIGR00153 family protein [Thermodesulfobacterium sp.]MDF2953104.1 Phosphate transport regulator YkaA [Candidatus Thermodesulfobacterium syntrophicum]